MYIYIYVCAYININLNLHIIIYIVTIHICVRVVVGRYTLPKSVAPMPPSHCTLRALPPRKNFAEIFGADADDADSDFSDSDEEEEEDSSGGSWGVGDLPRLATLFTSQHR